MLHRLKPFIVICGRNICLAIISMMLVCFEVKDVFAIMETIILPCRSGTYITIDSLYAYCGCPGACGNKLPCEGQTALIQGFVDYGNIFDRLTYPQLPYQKFLITNSERSRTLDVRVVSEGSEAVFRRIAEKKTITPDGPVYIKGVLEGIDMPIMGTCHRGLTLELTGAGNIQ